MSSQKPGNQRYNDDDMDSTDDYPDPSPQDTRYQMGGGLPNGKGEKQYAGGEQRLYEAYCDLHSLAQAVDHPLQPPAILVVGHQTSGKSALVEALMGFQFNHVGGGTKTRRPVALQMRYNPSRSQPACTLIMEDGEQEVTLDILQEYIEHENQRLEAESRFSSRQICVRVEYRHCPNLTIIDTPGLIAAPPGKKHAALQAASRATEEIATALMRDGGDHIILCVDDVADWTNATTRSVVMQVDPSLSRTVVVATKLDTKTPQFATGSDAEAFLHPPESVLDRSMMGGAPFFTSVPSGRVGSGSDCAFASSSAFRDSLASREHRDVQELEGRLGRRLERAERHHVGVSQLRRWLERLLCERYSARLPAMVALLDRRQRDSAERLAQLQRSLRDLHPDKLHERARAVRDEYVEAIRQLVRGTVAVSAEKYGETLADERLKCGAFVGEDQLPLIPAEGVPNAPLRLYGGAALQRAMADFRLSAAELRCGPPAPEEVANACGADPLHDGTDVARAACVIATARVRAALEPLIVQLGHRLGHVARRVLPAATQLVGSGTDNTLLLAGGGALPRRAAEAFKSFVAERQRYCEARAREDLACASRHVSWSAVNRGGRSLRALLAQVRPPDGIRALSSAAATNDGNKNNRNRTPTPAEALAANEAAAGAMADVLESACLSRDLGQLSLDVVAALVALVFDGIRDFVTTTVELKFNCLFIAPISEDFQEVLSEKLQPEELDHLLDVAAVKAALEQQQRQLRTELLQLERLQRKFAEAQAALSGAPPPPPALPAPQQDGETSPGAPLRSSLLSLTDSAAAMCFMTPKGSRGVRDGVDSIANFLQVVEEEAHTPMTCVNPSVVKHEFRRTVSAKVSITSHPPDGKLFS